MICIDSDCIIDFLKGKEQAVKIIRKYQEEAVSTEISVFEIFFGVYSKKNISENEELAAKNFFNSMEVLPFNQQCGEISSKILTSLIKGGNIIDQNDCFIASIMIKNGCDKIITKNEKHFSKIKGIKIIYY